MKYALENLPHYHSPRRTKPGVSLHSNLEGLRINKNRSRKTPDFLPYNLLISLPNWKSLTSIYEFGYPLVT